LIAIALILLSAPPVHASIIGKPANNLGLVGYWSFNEGSGSVAGDFSGNRNSGTIEGNVTWTTGVRGSALMFGGGDSDVSIPGFNQTLTGGGTIVAWIYATSPLGSCGGVVFSRGSASNTDINAGSCGNSTKMGYHWNENGVGGG